MISPPPAPGLSGTGFGKLLMVAPFGSLPVQRTLPAGPPASPLFRKAYSALPLMRYEVVGAPAGTNAVSLAGAVAGPGPTGAVQQAAVVQDATTQACRLSLQTLFVQGRPSSQ